MDPFASVLPRLPSHITDLVGEEPIPLVLLGSRAVHPLEDGVLDEDGQRSEDEGCKQVQVDVVPGAVQVSEGESRAPPWQDGQRWLPGQPTHTSGACASLGLW